ncbi:MAG: hypothetical protein R6V39_08270, partial [Desulfovibrionales bacterium]
MKTSIKKTNSIRAFFRNLTNSPDIVLDLWDNLFIFRGDELYRLSPGTLNTLPNFTFYFVEFAEATEVGFLDITAAPKYAELHCKKKLKNTGLTGSEDIAFIYFKQKMGKQNSRVFYQVIPKQKLNSLLENKAHKFRKGCLIFDSVSLAAGLINDLPGNRDHLLCLHTPRSLLCAGGSRGKINFLERYNLRSSSPENLHEGLAYFENAIQGLKGQGFQMDRLIWIETFMPPSHLKNHPLSIPIEFWPGKNYAYKKKNYWSSIPEIINKIPSNFSIGPHSEKFIRPFEKKEKWLYAALLLIILLTGFYNLSLREQSSTISDTVRQKKSEIAALKEKIPQAINMELPAGKKFSETVKLANSL